MSQGVMIDFYTTTTTTINFIIVDRLIIVSCNEIEKNKNEASPNSSTISLRLFSICLKQHKQRLSLIDIEITPSHHPCSASRQPLSIQFISDNNVNTHTYAQMPASDIEMTTIVMMMMMMMGWENTSCCSRWQLMWAKSGIAKCLEEERWFQL